MRQDPVVPQLTKQGQRMYSVASPVTQLFAISTSKDIEKNLVNLQKTINLQDRKL